jgi:hypothetical protein
VSTEPPGAATGGPERNLISSQTVTGGPVSATAQTAIRRRLATSSFVIVVKVLQFTA